MEYRAYNKIEKKFIKSGIAVGPGGKVYKISSIFKEAVETDDFEIQLFTGVVDINGQKIYAGDFIDFHFPESGKFKKQLIQWDCGSFCVGAEQFLFDEILDIEVVGNIYDS